MNNLRVEKNTDFEILGKTTKDKVQNTETEELIFGICSTIGSSKEIVIDSLKRRLKEYNYDVEIIKLSEFILENTKDELKNIDGKTAMYSEIQFKIQQGNKLRKNFSPSILADLAIEKIHGERLTIDGELVTDPLRFKTRRICYIIDSIKNKEELYLFRSIYKDLFYMFGIFSPLQERNEYLLRKDLSQAEIDELISTDSFENNTEGQNVRNTFIHADFFFRMSNKLKAEIDKKTERYLHLIFNSSIITPLKQERAMYDAQSAAGNSACLSRQVGAAIVDTEGNLISKGWNDVPKYGGNLYDENDVEDNRCFVKGYCSNDSEKTKMADSIFEIFDKNIAISDFLEKNQELKRELKNILRNSSRVKDLIEFSRSVHAEMHAIINGSQLAGSKMKNGKLYCTTYPCHNCARHIIVAGITEIYYIEPYIKSLCTSLHEDAITEDENSENSKKVKILMYDGVAPRRYLEFFTKTIERKNKLGQYEYNKIELTRFKPKTKLSLQALGTLEQQSVHSLNQMGFYDGK
ncbi:anti-phage dCTP deaminase [Marinigracilibium pacificum]|uniref:Deoxycytidylate deaminase n=1 Tax=Marinigracilibium pacificum TaxID=2729599 RepID=A0A848J495_9BACT|nr:anti-phage dCTP deaminase [Marinigracilibium pacificum]NMM50325.1 deoxycytidylate deaminase [Marinigracilibium pacificum]